ncbi:tetratricopeptide repeat protein [Granulicella arctica]|uniref:tetratricopeptide repeat protein n=1 Tax=Granulicella arctica TaxID=940613 RepID=UPI0021DF56E6|nr:tetratricopeptide repeat protein [Granulicella arctica]
MKYLQALVVVLSASLSASSTCVAQTSAVAERGIQAGRAVTATPAQERIAAAKRQLQIDPKKVQSYNSLATAYVRRARETDDPKYLIEGEKALAQGFAQDAKDFQLQKTEIALLLAEQRYTQAREKAAALNKRVPDDVMTYGYLAEADIALGSYAEAEHEAQWMLNLLPGNVPGLLLAARLRVLYGDPEGALQALNMAFGETSPTEFEEEAWIANQIARVQIDSGKVDAAASILGKTEQIFPGYPTTLANLARVRMAQKRPGDAVASLLEAIATSPDAALLYELGKAQRAAGHGEEARATDSAFLKAAKHAEPEDDVVRRDEAMLLASDPATAKDAMNIVMGQMTVRADVWSLDACAWVLYANGKYTEADSTIKRALAVGIADAVIYDHAGHIAQKLGNEDEAAKDFDLSLKASPVSEVALDARASLGAGTVVASALASSAPIADASEPSSQVIQPVFTSVAINKTTPTVFSPVPVAYLTPRQTDTDRVVRTAQEVVAHAPKDSKGYASLGAAYFQRARETGDVSDYQRSEEALNKSLDLVSADFSADAALQTMAEVCMGEHRFADALTFSQKALALGSGDVSPFAIVGDAYADMGEYAKAGEAYARLTPKEMTLSPRAAYARDSRLSYLSFIAGDTPKAIAQMKVAVGEGSVAQLPAENLAWLYYELGEYEIQAGDIATADAAYLQALEIHPGDYRAMAGLAKLRANQGRHAEAIVFYQKAIAVVPMPIFIAELGDLYAKAGNQAEAKKQYQLVEYIGLLGHINQVLHNRDLALFYADHDVKLSESLELAQRELEVRHDVYTYDALAWSLYKNRRYGEAAKASEEALQFGTKDALLVFHAAMIAEKMGQPEKAKDRFREALAINPHFHVIDAPIAQQQLALLETQASNGANEIHAH